MGACNIVIIVLSIIGVVLVIVGAILGFKVLPDYIDDQLILNAELKEKTEQYERFEKLPFALDFNVYMFNLLNPEKVMDGSEKPNMQEIGPFKYAKSLRKDDIVVNEKESFIEYNQIDLFELKKDSESDDKRMTTLNVPLAAVLLSMEDINLPILNKLFNDGYLDAFEMKPNTLFMDISVSQYTFGGYKFCDPLKIQKNAAAKALCGIIRLMATESMEIGDDRVISFTFLKMKHDNPGGRFKVNSGLKKVSDVGLISEWKNSKTTKFWKDNSKCNEVRGCDSMVYPPNNDKDKVFPVFNTDICRSVELAYSKEMEYKDIEGYRSTIKPDTMSNTGENECYCIKQTRNLQGKKECLPTGFMDMHSCLGAPIVLSFPHFMWADEAYSKTVSGLSPNEEKHIIYVEMEPNTGTPLVGRKRVQFNMILRPIDLMPITKLMKPAVFPLLWIEEGTDLSDKLINKLKEEYFDKLVLVDAVTWTLIGVGIAMFIGFGILYICRR